jgi:Ca2+-binding RTX toxin-like protein
LLAETYLIFRHATGVNVAAVAAVGNGTRSAFLRSGPVVNPHNDHLFGGAGKDIVVGGTGNDNLFGGRGKDAMYGGHGIDLIHAGSGVDKCRSPKHAPGCEL